VDLARLAADMPCEQPAKWYPHKQPDDYNMRNYWLFRAIHAKTAGASCAPAGK
jgi:hypothetical protein